MDSTGLPVKPLYRPDEVAEYFSVHVRTIYNWLECGALKGIKIQGVIRIPREANPLLKQPITALISTDGSLQIKIL